MKKTVIALFNSYGEAERALSDALESGFDRDSVSIMAMPNPNSETPRTPEGEHSNIGASATVGGIAGAALGLTALAIPGVGPLVAAGPVAAALGATGAAAGAGGLAGLLIGLGITNDDAKTYARGVHDGGAIVAIHTDENREAEAESLLRSFDPARIDETTGSAEPVAPVETRPFENASDQPHKTESGPTHFAPVNPNYSSSFDEFAGVFGRRHAEFFGERGDDYDPYREAYEFGYRCATSDDYALKAWADAEPDLRREWTGQERDWDPFRDAVRMGWESARGSG